MARDGEGNLYLTGWTYSDDFPLIRPIQAEMAEPACRQAGAEADAPCGDAFLVKLSPDGSRILFSTYLGGLFEERAHAVAVDAQGNAYVAGTTHSADFPSTVGEAPETPNNRGRAFVTKIDPAGSRIVYSRVFSVRAGVSAARAITVSAAGVAAITGTAHDSDLATPGAFQATQRVAALWITDDGGRTWTSSDDTFAPGAIIHDAAFDPTDSGILVAAAAAGLFRSADAGRTWERTRPPSLSESFTEVAADPTRPATFYAAGLTGGALRSRDTGETWEPINTGLADSRGSPRNILSLDVDPLRGVIFAGVVGGLLHSEDGGDNWSVVFLQREDLGDPSLHFLVRSPADRTRVYACCGTQGMLVSNDGGDTWQTRGEPLGLVEALTAHPTQPDTVYRGTNANRFKSAVGRLLVTRDAGLSWEALTAIPGGGGSPIQAVDFHPADPAGRLFVSVANDNAIYTTTDADPDWSKIFLPIPAAGRWLAADGDRWLFQALTSSEDAFAAKLDPNGEVLFATYLGGLGYDSASAVGLDADGSVVIAGHTGSIDFPTKNAVQDNLVFSDFSGDRVDAFVAKVTADGAALRYSTYFGGSGVDRSTALALDDDGSVYVTGATESADWPVTAAALQDGLAGVTDGFLFSLGEDGDLRSSANFGGNSLESPNAIAVDERGAAVVVGDTASWDYPTRSPIQPADGSQQFSSTGFVSRFAPDASQLEFSTFYGGSEPTAVALGPRDSIYFAGATFSAGLPLRDARQDLRPGRSAGFHARIDFGPFPDPAPPAPQILSLHNAAGFKPGHLLSPGALHTLFGRRLADGRTAAGSLPLPTVMDGVEVRLDGQPVPLLFASAGQINFVVPADRAEGLAILTVVGPNGTSAPWRARVAKATPGVFTWDGTGGGDAVAVHAEDFRPVTAEDPAITGDIITVFATGFGRVVETIPPGAAAPPRPVPIVGEAWAQLDFGSVEVLYSGLAPGFTGVYQMNLRVRNTNTGRWPLRIGVGDRVAPVVLIHLENMP